MEFTDRTLGRMLSLSKQAPSGHECVWNANVCVKSAGKIWFGDIDLTDDGDALQALANERAEAVYVLREHDGRFHNEASPRFENAVRVFEPVP